MFCADFGTRLMINYGLICLFAQQTDLENQRDKLARLQLGYHTGRLWGTRLTVELNTPCNTPCCFYNTASCDLNSLLYNF